VMGRHGNPSRGNDRTAILDEAKPSTNPAHRKAARWFWTLLDSVLLRQTHWRSLMAHDRRASEGAQEWVVTTAETRC
jgi:hypothetical protein